jgi:KaiC/GvpD/RAD55 family RecA-like ATPase
MVQVVLYSIRPEKYFQEVLKILKTASKGNSLIYVTTNKPYSYLTRSFKEKGINADKIFFVDCISEHIKEKIPEAANCVSVESPQNLTAISIAVNESIKNLKGKIVLLFDSMSVLLIYNDAAAVGKFSNFLISKMRSLGVDMIILALESDIDKDVLKQIESFSDKVIRA